MPVYRPIGELLHIPLRSGEQMARKITLSWLAALARAQRSAAENAHWRQMIERLAAGALDDEDVIGCAADYGDPDRPARRMNWEELARSGFARRALDVASAPGLPDLAGEAADPLRLLASALREWNLEDPQDRGLYLEGDALRLHPSEPEAPKFGVAEMQLLLEEAQARTESLTRMLETMEQELRESHRHEDEAEAMADAAQATAAELRASASFRIGAPLRKRIGRIVSALSKERSG
jgi:hypothetical protein